MTLRKRRIRSLIGLAVLVAVLACITFMATVRPRQTGDLNRNTTPNKQGLESLDFAGHELHESLRTIPLERPIRHLPPDLMLPENPHYSTDSEFVATISRSSSQGRLDSEGIHAALYARYIGETELGIYGLEADSTAEADLREEALRDIWVHNMSLDRASVHRKGLVLVVIWHDGVSPECWASVNAKVAERLNVSDSSSGA